MADRSQARPTATEKTFQTENPEARPLLPWGHPSVAFFSSSPGGLFAFEKWQMWRGISEAARTWGINLVYVSGEEFESSPQSVLYDLIGKHNIEGLIFWNSFFSPYSTLEKTQEFVERYKPLPIVSIELAIKGACSLLVDNTQGVRDVLAHLIDVHGYRKIAFLNERKANSTFSRQSAFTKVMAEYGMLNPALVGTLSEWDARGLRPGVDYQAIVADTDYPAVQTIEALQARGILVPDDVAITGFNDSLDARGSLPPLTTARLPFRQQGSKAVEILARWLKGEQPPEQVIMPMQLILRRSCGCLEPLAESAASQVTAALPPNQTLAGMLANHRQDIIAQMAAVMAAPVDNLGSTWAASIFDSFLTELNVPQNGSARPSSHAYLKKLNAVLRDAVEEGLNVSRWHEALSILRRSIRPYLQGQVLETAEDLWQQARILIGQAAVRTEVHRNLKMSQRADVLRSLEAAMMTSMDFDELLNVLAGGLSGIAVSNFCLVLYEDPSRPDGWARLILRMENGQRVPIEAGKERFLSRNLLPQGCLPTDQPFGLIIEALHLRDEQLGYMVFRTQPPLDASQCDIYQALRIQLANAIKEVRLRQNLQDALQRAEEANLLKSRFLSMVSHELRTPINLIVGLSEMAIRQQNNDRKASLEVLKKFNEQIYTSGQHLDRLIRDVLDLASSQAGQMNLIRSPLNLVPVLRDVVSIGTQLAEQKNLRFRVEIPDKLPQVMGDKTRLRQIMLNLISNAVKFTAHGEVALLVKIENEEILITIEDTGLGIAKEEQECIFDEFHQSDRTTVRGYGGIGLGLAITRRLVEMHGGRIWVTSKGWEGSGSRFCFTLPVLRDCDSDPAEDCIEPNSREGIVLILTKTPGSAEKLVRRLEDHGFMVQEMVLESGVDFIEQLVSSPPGAVVLDLAPASEQGWDIMKKLKEEPSTQDVPVLFYSLLSNEDAGAVVEIDFIPKPIGTEQLIQALKRRGLNTNRKNLKTILMIDDEPSMLELHQRMVQSALPDCKILTAQSGAQGLQIMRSTLPDLVLLDLMMPEMDGFHVLRVIQEEQMLRNIPVIILSAQILTRREMEQLNQGVAAVLEKGLFSARETISRIERALARNKRLGSESQRLVHHAMAHIHEHFHEPLSRGDIANHLSVNEQYLSRCFNKEMGIGPMTYLSRYRIQQAKNLLEIGTMSVTQVALEVGFSSQSYFSRIFQQETGITPTEYQNGVRPPLP